VLVPFGDEPILAKILALYQQVSLAGVIIIVSPHEKERFDTICHTYQQCWPIKLIVQENASGLLPAIIQASEELQHVDEICIHLADTLFTKPFKEKDFVQSFVLAAKVAESSAWAIVTSSATGEINTIVDKPTTAEAGTALCGCYFFKRAQLFRQALATLNRENVEISALLLAYNQLDGIQVRLRKDWSDIGNVKHLHALTESFSTYKKVQVVRQDNVVIKKTKHSDIEREQYFYRHFQAPEIMPRVLSSTAHKLKLGYIPVRSLAYYALFERIQNQGISHIWQGLLASLQKNFYSKSGHWLAGKAQTNWMYGQRVIDLVQQDSKELAEVKYWLLNGKKVIGFEQLHETLLNKAKQLAKTAKIRVIHGDLHLANILYDPYAHVFFFVDPRGTWGNQYSIYGDIRYDLAKLLHSLHGGYEYLKRGLVKFRETGHNSFSFELPTDMWQSVKNIQPLLDQYRIPIADVMWIEALCFLSMIRCYENKALKKQFFLQGLYLLNQLL